MEFSLGSGGFGPNGSSTSRPARLTAIVNWVPSRYVGAPGRGFSRPPSTSVLPSISFGVMRPGIAIDARMASNRSPRVIHTSLWSLMSVATAANGSGRSSMVRSPTSSRSVSVSMSPFMMPFLVVSEKSRKRTTSHSLRLETHSSNLSSFPAQ